MEQESAFTKEEQEIIYHAFQTAARHHNDPVVAGETLAKIFRKVIAVNNGNEQLRADLEKQVAELREKLGKANEALESANAEIQRLGHELMKARAGITE